MQAFSRKHTQQQAILLTCCLTSYDSDIISWIYSCVLAVIVTYTNTAALLFPFFGGWIYDMICNHTSHVTHTHSFSLPPDSLQTVIYAELGYRTHAAIRRWRVNKKSLFALSSSDDIQWRSSRAHGRHILYCTHRFTIAYTCLKQLIYVYT